MKKTRITAGIIVVLGRQNLFWIFPKTEKKDKTSKVGLR